jgi:hypothetical protein
MSFHAHGRPVYSAGMAALARTLEGGMGWGGVGVGL